MQANQSTLWKSFEWHTVTGSCSSAYVYSNKSLLIYYRGSKSKEWCGRERLRSSHKWWLPSSNKISWQFQFQHKHFLPGVISTSCSVSVTSCQRDTSCLCCIILVAPVTGRSCGLCVGHLVWQRSVCPHQAEANSAWLWVTWHLPETSLAISPPM